MKFISNTKYFLHLQLLLTVVLLWAAFFGGYDLSWWIYGIIGYFITGCLGVTLTFHRYLSHKSFTMPKWLEYLFSFFGAMGGTGSSVGWVWVHREHHKHSDEEVDPHSPKHHGWKVLFPNYELTGNKYIVRDLITDKFHFILHKYYYLILIGWASLLTLLFGIKGFIFLFAMPVVLQIWVSVLSNYINHSKWFPGGYRNYDIKDDSVNHFLIALISWGEGWHNNHHYNTRSYSFKRKWWEFDLTAFIIDLIRTDRKKI